jgi:hypothetical protein
MPIGSDDVAVWPLHLINAVKHASIKEKALTNLVKCGNLLIDEFRVYRIHLDGEGDSIVKDAILNIHTLSLGG